MCVVNLKWLHTQFELSLRLGQKAYGIDVGSEAHSCFSVCTNHCRLETHARACCFGGV